MQLAVVGAAIALVFEFPALAAAFVAVMVATAGLTAGSRLRGLPGARARALAAIALPALAATGALLAVGAFELTARAAVPTAGILIGGAMAATTLTGRRLLESLHDDTREIETRLALGDSARMALAPAIRRAVHTGLVPGRRPDAQRRPRHAAGDVRRPDPRRRVARGGRGHAARRALRAARRRARRRPAARRAHAARRDPPRRARAPHRRRPLITRARVVAAA